MYLVDIEMPVNYWFHLRYVYSYVCCILCYYETSRCIKLKVCRVVLLVLIKSNKSLEETASKVGMFSDSFCFRLIHRDRNVDLHETVGKQCYYQCSLNNIIYLMSDWNTVR